MIELTKVKWKFWHIRERTPILLYFFFRGATISSLDFFNHNIQTNGSICNHIVTKEDEFNNFKLKLWGAFRQNSKSIYDAMLNQYTKKEEDLLILKNFIKTDFSIVENKELAKLYLKYIDLMLSYGKFVYTPLAIESLLESEVLKLIESNKLNSDELNIVFSSVKNSIVTVEKKSLLNISLINDLELQQQLLQEHIEKFSFMKKKGFFMDFYNQHDYFSRLSKINDAEQQLMDIKHEEKLRKDAFEKILDKFKDDGLIVDLLKTTNESVYFRSWRTEVWDHSSFYVVSLYKEIAKRLNLLEYKDLLYYLPFEIESALNKKTNLNLNLVGKRKSNYIYITNGKDDYVCISGDEAKKVCDKINFFDVNTNKIKGTPVFNGVVTGKVSIILCKEDYYKIHDAEIIVANSTLPDMVPYFSKKLKAIITDEGGILSHASILSRELKIPCIIGTHTATKILNDGDFVSVDAVNGIVKKINN